MMLRNMKRLYQVVLQTITFPPGELGQISILRQMNKKTNQSVTFPGLEKQFLKNAIYTQACTQSHFQYSVCPRLLCQKSNTSEGSKLFLKDIINVYNYNNSLVSSLLNKHTNSDCFHPQKEYIIQRNVRYFHTNQICNCPSDYSVKNGKTKKVSAQEELTKTLKDNIQKENIITIPNILTMGRIVMTPYLGYLVLNSSFPLACGLFLLAGFSDLVDGWIARNVKNQMSAFGSFLDPLADKFLVSVLFVTLSMVDVIPVLLTTAVISRDVLLIFAAFYVRFVSLPPPRTLTTFFNATTVSAQLKPLLISKVNTALQILLITVSLAAPVFDFMGHPLLQALWYLTAGTTGASAIGYMFAKDTYKVLKRKRKP